MNLRTPARGLRRLLALAPLLAVSCTSGDSPVGLPTLTVAASLQPVGGPQLASPSDAGPVVQIRVTVRTDPDGTVVAETLLDVDPSADAWSVGVDIPSVEAPAYVIDFELLSAGGTVEWSGRMGPLTLSQLLALLFDISVYPGPLTNLAATDLTIFGPPRLVVGETFGMEVDVTSSDPTPPVVYWSSLDAGVTSVDGNGLVTALAAGTGMIQAQVGPLTAVHRLVVVAGSGGPVVDASYVTVGNTELVAGSAATPPTTPYVQGGSNPVESIGGVTVTRLGPITTSEGGTALFEADGDLSYTPPFGFTGRDAFPLETDQGSATVFVDVANIVHYVDNRAAGPGTGLSSDPFTTVGDAVAGLPDGGTVFIGFGTGTYPENVVLGPQHTVVGASDGLLTFPSFAVVQNTQGPRPTIEAATSLPALTLAPDSRVEWVRVSSTTGAGVYATGSLGQSSQAGITITGAPAVFLENTTGSFVIEPLDVIALPDNEVFSVDGGDPVVEVRISPFSSITNTDGYALAAVFNTTGGSVTFTGGPLRSLGYGGVYIGNTAGPVTFDSPVELQLTRGDAILVNGSTAPITFDSVTMDLTNVVGVNVNGALAPFTIRGGEIVTDSADAIYSFDSDFDVTLSRISVTNTFSSAIYTVGVYGSIDVGRVDMTSDVGQRTIGIGAFNTTTNPFAVTVGGGNISADQDPVAYFQNAQFDVRLDDVFTDAEGFVFDQSSGTITVASGTVAEVGAYGASNVTADLNVDVVATDAFRSVVVVRDSDQVQIDINGSVTDALGGGILLQNNTSTTTTFNGPVVITTGDAPVAAFDGGAIEMTAAGSSIAATSGTAIQLTNTDIGSAGMTLESVSTAGTGNLAFGVNLENVTGGAFAITGAGTQGSGGTLRSNNPAIRLVNVQTVSITDVDLVDVFSNAVTADAVDALTLDGVRVTNSGARVTAADAILVTAGPEVTLVDLSVDGAGARDQGVNVTIPDGGLSTVTISGGTFTNLTSGAIDIAPLGTAQVAATVVNTTVRNAGSAIGLVGQDATAVALMDGNSASGVQDGIVAGTGVGAAAAQGALDLTVTNNVISALAAPIRVESSEAGKMCLDIRGNAATVVDGFPIEVIRSSGSGAQPAFQIERLNGGSGTVNDPSVVINHILAENPASNFANAASVSPMAWLGVPDGSCITP